MGSNFSTPINQTEQTNNSNMTQPSWVEYFTKMLFGHEDDAVISEPVYTAEMFADLSKHNDVITKFTDTTLDKLTIPTTLMTQFIEDLVIFIDTYIDLSKMGGKYSKLWKGYKHYEDKTLRHNAIRDKIKTILKFRDDEKSFSEISFASWLKDFVTHTTGDQCGGFKVPDFRDVKDVDTMTYMHNTKLKHMKNYIKRKIGNGNSGFIFATEYDWDDCLDDTCTNINFHRCNTELHKDNSGKGLFYTKDFNVRELDEKEIKGIMTETSSTNYMKLYEKYASKFVVFSVTNSTENTNDMFYDEVFVIGLHLKSMGTKSEIIKNMKEYKFIKSMLDSFKDKNSIVIGDFNLPEFSEGIDYFKLNAEDRIWYPYQDSYGDFNDKDGYIFEGYTKAGQYDKQTVAYKIRSGHCGINSQSLVGKSFKRGYNTDGGHVRGEFIEGVTFNSTLYPPNKADVEVVIPMFTGYEGGDWGSDHQVVEMTMKDKTEKTYTMCAYNVLSKCCSGGQPFKSSLSCEEIEYARNKQCEFIARLSNFIM